MQIKTTPSITVLYFSTTTTLKDVGQYALVVAKNLYAEAARQNILPVGPVYWLYYDCNGNMSDPFTLEIALPLESAPTLESEFSSKELPPFKAVSYFFDGPWEKIFEAYDRIISWTKSNGYTLTENFREAYIYMTNDYKLTEINVGIE